MTARPKSLDITAEQGVLIGTDQDGNRWTIRWCGNGQYSHWSLGLVDNPGTGWYVYVYPEHNERELKDQIIAAEHKYRIYS